MAKLTEDEKARRKAVVQRCIDAYYAAYVRRFNPPELADSWLAEMAAGVQPARRSVPKEHMNLPMIAGAKHGAQIKKMVDTWGEGRVLDLCGRFPAMDHPRVRSSDRSIGALFNLAQYLLLDGQSEVGAADARLAGNASAARKAAGR